MNFPPSFRVVLPAAWLATTAAPHAAELDFYRDVFPFLKANCIACHNKTTAKADLDMETPESMKKGGEGGPAIVAGKSAESLVVQASLHQNDMEMPPKNNKSGAHDLTPEEIAKLKLWIDQGAKNSVQQERQVVWQPLAPGVHPIYSVAMTQDGRYAACGRGNQIFVYDLALRQFVSRIADPAQGGSNAHRDLVQSLAFSPDGTRLASGSFREVKIWKLQPSAAPVAGAPPAAATPVAPALVQKLAAAAKVAVLSQAASADGKLVATGCADGSVRVWDAASAKAVIELRGSPAASRRLAELDRTIAAQTLEQTFQKAEITRIEAQEKALDELLKKANEAITAMQKVLPDKQKAVKPAEEARTAAQKAVEAVTAKIATAAGGKPDAALAKELKDAQGKLITAKMTETSAQAAVSATESNVHDAKDEVQRITETKARNAKLLAAAQAASAAAKKRQDQATADLAAAKQALATAAGKPQAVCFSADARRVAALFDDGSLRVWAVASGMPLEETRATAAPAALTAGADGSFTARQAVTLSTAGTPRWTLERVLGGAAGSPLVDRVNAVRFSPDGKTLAAGSGEPSRSGDLSLWQVADGKLLQQWKERHSDTVLCLDFSPDGKHLASGGADKQARVTDIASGRQVRQFEGHTHYVLGIAYRADGRVLATAGADNAVLVWDLLLGERKKKIEGWTKEVTSLQFIGATNQILTSAGDNRVRIVTDEGAEVRAMAALPDFMQSVASAPGLIVAGGEDSRLRVWSGSDGKELAVFGSP